LTATDNCGTATVSMTETRVDGNCPNNYVLTRTWTATDLCGNTSTASQTLTVSDNTAPVISCPAAIVMNCFGALPAPYADFGAFQTAGGSASDNCGLNSGSFAMVSTTGGPTNYVRTYSITDQCGNVSSCTQSITMASQLNLSVVTTVPCYGVNNGEATATVTGGVGPYTYLWSNGQTSNPAILLAVGSYTVTVTDANGCTVSGNVVVTSQAPVNSGFHIQR
jgi:hypothetical protein